MGGGGCLCWGELSRPFFISWLISRTFSWYHYVWWITHQDMGERWHYWNGRHQPLDTWVRIIRSIVCLSNGGVSIPRDGSGWNIINSATRTGTVLAISRNGGRTTIAWTWGRLGLALPRLVGNGSSVKAPCAAGGSVMKPRNTAGWISNARGGFAPTVLCAAARQIYFQKTSEMGCEYILYLVLLLYDV